MILPPLLLKQGFYTANDLADLRKEQKIFQEFDIYQLQSQEVFEISHPDLINDPDQAKLCQEFLRSRPIGEEAGNWGFFPWSGRLVHMVVEDEYQALRTNRNRNLITAEEQKQLRDFTVGIVGLSVGSNIAGALAYSGISDAIKLVEFDDLETSNLNRVRGRVDQVGRPKIEVVAQQIYEINPYARVIGIEQGLNGETMAEFVKEDPQPKMIFEIIDDFKMKLLLRDFARRQGLPLAMVTNLGDRILFDLERYDLNADLEYFNGRAGEISKDILDNQNISAEDMKRYAVELVGKQHVPQRALETLSQIGKTLVGRPQLAGTITVCAGFAAYLTRKIALKQSMDSASWFIDFDSLFSYDNRTSLD